MKLKELVKDEEYCLVKGSIDHNIARIVSYSEKVVENALFICIKGHKTDGHLYIDEAIKKGAKVLVIEKDIEIKEAVTVIRVNNSRKLLAKIANVFYDYPSRKFNLVGVTGTNGKTSTVFLIHNILKEYGKRVGIIGTIENRVHDQVLKSNRTTPDILDIQNLFQKMYEEQVEVVSMEVSSHALSLSRVDYCDFDIGVFTNLSHDHLEFHHSLNEYRDAKMKLFTMCKCGVVNIDDPVGVNIVDKQLCNHILTYGCNNSKADINAIEIKSEMSGTTFMCKIKDISCEVRIQTPGRFSVYNALAAIGVCLMLELPICYIISALKKNSCVGGRFQSIKLKKGAWAIVDYAHTPDGLENVLSTINEIKKRQVITVFGCGGDRDKSKRKKMGEIAGQYSDFCIVTSDNPRTEDPYVIMEEVEKGVKVTETLYILEIDRENAIKKAIAMARTDDIILIAGKGHENYQIIGKEKIHLDDVEIINNIN